jgi:hypothetical protein
MRSGAHPLRPEAQGQVGNNSTADSLVPVPVYLWAP